MAIDPQLQPMYGALEIHQATTYEGIYDINLFGVNPLGVLTEVLAHTAADPQGTAADTSFRFASAAALMLYWS